MINKIKNYKQYILIFSVILMIPLLIWIIIPELVYPLYLDDTPKNKLIIDIISTIIYMIIPLLVVFFTIKATNSDNKMQREINLQIAKKQRESDLEIAKKQRESDLEIAIQQRKQYARQERKNLNKQHIDMVIKEVEKFYHRQRIFHNLLLTYDTIYNKLPKFKNEANPRYSERNRYARAKKYQDTNESFILKLKYDFQDHPLIDELITDYITIVEKNSETEYDINKSSELLSISIELIKIFRNYQTTTVELFAISSQETLKEIYSLCHNSPDTTNKVLHLMMEGYLIENIQYKNISASDDYEKKIQDLGINELFKSLCIILNNTVNTATIDNYKSFISYNNDLKEYHLLLEKAYRYYSNEKEEFTNTNVFNRMDTFSVGSRNLIPLSIFLVLGERLYQSSMHESSNYLPPYKLWDNYI